MGNVFDDIKSKINNGYYITKLSYPRRGMDTMDNYITDENKSVKWNREQVQKNLNSYKKQLEEYKEDEKRKMDELQEGVINSVTSNYLSINREAAKFLFGEAYEETHDEGMTAVLDKLEDLIEVVLEFNRLNKN